MHLLRLSYDILPLAESGIHFINFEYSNLWREFFIKANFL